MTVIAHDPYITPEAATSMGVRWVELGELFASSDFITLHTPQTKETECIINRSTIAKMRQGTRIINCARGGLIDEEDLYDALKDGHLAGAALDVFSSEPPKDNPLITLENVICQSAYLIRRGEWLCSLCESSLTWESRITGNRHILMIFKGGKMFLRETIATQEELSIPPGYKKTLLERQNCFDLMTYDRMRVLTSEIKRIVSEGRDINLKLGPKFILTYIDLKRVLRWL